MKRLLAICTLFAATLTAAELREVQLCWTYPESEIIPDMAFRLYSTTNSALPLAEWKLLASFPGTMARSGSNFTCLISLEVAQRFYCMTVSNLWDESPPSRVVATPALPRNDVNLRIERRP